MTTGFIYILRNTVNDLVYIGQCTTSVKQRMGEHHRHSRYWDYCINQAIREIGFDHFYMEILENCDVDKLDERETYYIALYDSTDRSKGYNVSIGGKTPRFKEKELDIEELKRLYVEEQLPLQAIADRFETTLWIVRRDLQSAGVIIRDRHDSACKVNKMPKEFIQKCLAEGKSLRGGAKVANIPYSTFRNACQYYKVA